MKKLIFAVILTIGVLSVFGEDAIYQITGNVTGGIDLLNMAGYRSDCLAGPSAANVTVAGTITHTTGTREHPFEVIGNGKRIYFTSTSTLGDGPLLFRNADGVTAVSTYWPAKGIFKDVEIRANTTFSLVAEFILAGTGSEEAVFRANGNAAWFSSGSTAPVIGSQDGDGRIVLCNGGKFDANVEFSLGRERSPGRASADIRAAMELDHGTFNLYDKTLYLLNGIVGSNVERCVITNGPSSVIRVGQICHQGGDFSRLVFAGGKLRSEAASTLSLFAVNGIDWKGGYHNPILTLEAMGDNPIDIEITNDRNLVSGFSDRRLFLKGTGGFVKRGAGVLTLNRLGATCVCDYTGPTVVKAGGLSLQYADFAPGRGALTIESGAFVELNGVATSFTGVDGAGTLRNSSETTATVTLGAGDANGTFDIATVTGPIALVKVGAGVLTVGSAGAGYSGDLTIEAGTVKLAANATSFGKVTVARGATLDLRGFRFACRDFVNLGRVLTDGDSSVAFGGADDSLLANAALSLGGDFVKTGTGTLTVYGLAAVAGKVDVKAGRLACHAARPFAGKYFKLVEQQSADSTRNHKMLAEFALYDAGGNRVNLGMTYRDLGKRTDGSDAGLKDASTLQSGEMALGNSGFYGAVNLNPPNNMCDGNVETYCDIQAWWGSEFVLMRLSDAADPVMSYGMTAYNKNYTLATWQLYGSYDGISWTLLDDKSVDWTDPEAKAVRLAELPQEHKTDYNGGLPYMMVDGQAAVNPFGDGSTVSVAAGATLAFANVGLQIAKLEVDMTAGGGTIERFTAAPNGILSLTNAPEALALRTVLPLSVGELAGKENLKSWKVLLNGVETSGYTVEFREGRLVAGPRSGATIILK